MVVSATFRAASSQDAECIVRVMQGYYAEAGYAFDARAARCAVDGLLSRSEVGQVWCVEVAGVVAGNFVLAMGYSFEYRGVDAFLDELYVLPDYRGKGIGRAVIARVEDRARSLGVRALHLAVETAKPQMIARYRRWGFREHHRLLMTKLL